MLPVVTGSLLVETLEVMAPIEYPAAVVLEPALPPHLLEQLERRPLRMGLGFAIAYRTTDKMGTLAELLLKD